MNIPFVHAAGQEQTLKVGLVGCGGRGTGAADNVLDSSENVQVIALADMFPDKIEKTRKVLKGKEHPGVKIQDDFCFAGFDAYRKILEAPIDYVILAQPPGFRPPHFTAAVEAGKHVFFEKPVAVDPVGVRKIIEMGEVAKQKKLGVIPGTQTRHTPRAKETVRRIHDGQIGEIVSGRIMFNTGYLWEYPRRDGMSDMEWQIRNWYYFDWLSGDFIVEQHVHQHDCTDWVLQASPVSATAVGGRQMRTEELYGNIFDHFCVDYTYPNGVHVQSMCRQWKGTPGEICAIYRGTKGTAYVMGPRAGTITGDHPWEFKPEAKDVDPATGKEINGTILEHRDLIASIRAGKPLNEARRIALTSLTSILGREAAYTGKSIQFDDLLKSDLDLSPKRYEFGPNEVRPVRRPGV
jgi:myo-inositol 2-dehydrogenase / D-chiro-inositol 1-dehydrogenase